jgi:hypothetical protein
MLLAAELLGDRATLGELVEAIHAIRFDQLRDADGYVLRGVRDDGATPLRSAWREWGGETALVQLLEEMATGKVNRLPLQHAGRFFRGTGFIGEIASLFYAEFGLDRQDSLSGVNWLQARRQLLKEQMEYFPRSWPQSAAARLGLYGLSAGEGPRGAGYVVNGTQRANVKLIHPHYILMAGLLQPPEATNHLLATMQSAGLMPPWGIVENTQADLSEYLPWIGSLNASFECLGSYHLWARQTGGPDLVYEAASRSPPLQSAIGAFYLSSRPSPANKTGS